ncbi:MAG: hypothetical protein ACYSX0_13145 [Planctomycetota bacterium]
MIREVETDSNGRVVVTIEETAENVTIPPRCAECLGEPTKRLPIPGVAWLEFPYCDECVAPRTKAKPGTVMTRTGILAAAALLALFVSLWLGILGFLVLTTFRHGRGGSAVRLAISESGTVRLEFENEEYARSFVEANESEHNTDPSPR